jgi:hypothetical protein
LHPEGKEPGSCPKYCSADHYFTDIYGRYRFYPAQIHNAHKFCQEKAEQYMREEWRFIIIDNTNIQRKHFQFYIDKAKEYGYLVWECQVGDWIDALNGKVTTDNLELAKTYAAKYAARNVHGVTADKILQLMQRWEP